jgi:hypothetical protein
VPERSLPYSRPDRRQDLGQVFPNRLVWESNHPITGYGEDRLSFGISILLFRMNPAVELDDKTTLGTAEVDDESTDWMLPAELDSIQATTAQLFPQDVLNQCLAGAEVPCRRDVLAMLAMATTHVFSFACPNSCFGAVGKAPTPCAQGEGVGGEGSK